ncbi:MAG: PrsW family intramembrane metalloprotease [Patescibacteria group bacterium]
MGSIYTTFALVLLGFSPSLVWLAYYLRKDPRPEPKYMISRVFFLGIVLAPLAVIAQWAFRETALSFHPSFQSSSSIAFFLWAAFIEEAVKFLPVKFAVLHNPEFDEPVDGMIYMIAAALGFAAIENVLVLFQAIPSGAGLALQTWALRFIGATLLHAVSSAMVGYFLALSWFYHRHSGKLIFAGIAVASVFHFLFNFTLLKGEGPDGFFYSTILLIVVAVVISFLFTKIKKRANGTMVQKSGLSTETALP